MRSDTKVERASLRILRLYIALEAGNLVTTRAWAYAHGVSWRTAQRDVLLVENVLPLANSVSGTWHKAVL